MSYSLFVKPVNHMSESFIRTLFSKYGDVDDVYIPKEYKSQRRKNFGYVKYESKHAAASAIEALHNSVINGHEISVQWSSNSSKTPEEMIAIKEQRASEKKDTGVRFTEEEHEKFIAKRKRPEGDFHDRYFTAVDYPPSVGEEFTPIYQKNLPPLGERRTFFTWSYIPPEKVEKILGSYLAKTSNENREQGSSTCIE